MDIKDTEAEMSRRKTSSSSFTGAISIYCEETGKNVVNLLEDIEYERPVMRQQGSLEDYDYEEEEDEPLCGKFEYCMISSAVPIFDCPQKRTRIVCAIGPASRVRRSRIVLFCKPLTIPSL